MLNHNITKSILDKTDLSVIRQLYITNSLISTYIKLLMSDNSTVLCSKKNIIMDTNIHKAMYLGYRDVVNILRKKIINQDFNIMRFDEIIASGIKGGQIELVDDLLHKYQDRFELKVIDWSYIIRYAGQTGEMSIVKYIEDKIETSEYHRSKDESFYHELLCGAAKYGKKEVSMYAIEGIEKSTSSDSRYTDSEMKQTYYVNGLEYACRGGNLDIINTLRSKIVDERKVIDAMIYGNILAGNYEEMDTYIKMGFYDFGWALNCAMHTNDEKIIRYIIKRTDTRHMRISFEDALRKNKNKYRKAIDILFEELKYTNLRYINPGTLRNIRKASNECGREDISDYFTKIIESQKIEYYL
jgi:hypothetical protein